MSKEVLISQRQGAAPMGGGDGGPVMSAPVSNYKGVMLCDRPGPKNTGNYGMTNEPPPFLSSVVPKEQLGLNPSRETRDQRVSHHGFATQHRDKNKFLTRHKQWLSEFKKMKETVQKGHEEDEQEKEARRRKFAEYSAKLRKAIRRAEEDPSGVEEELRRKEEARRKKAEEKAKAKAASKPAWARTEKDEELAEEAEVDDLLEFAKSLDYDKIMEDVEVRTALKNVRTRIAQLDESVADNEYEDDTEEESVLQGDDWKEKFASEWEKLNQPDRRPAEVPSTSDRPRSTKSANSRVRPESTASRRDIDTQDLDPERALLESSKRALHSSASLRRIHSSRSIRTILEKSAVERQRQDGTTVIATLPPVDEGDEMVVNYIHKDVEDNRRPRREIDPSNLPYLHRNPAV